jgi:hypothetical protein
MRPFPRLLAAAALLTAVTAPLAAQGAPGGGMGGPGGGMQRMMQMASLERPLQGVAGITDTQKAALTKIEDRMKKDLGEAMGAMRDMMMAARQSGEQPDQNEMRKTREAMQKMREQAHADARAVLTDAQRPTFDANLKAMQEEEAKRAAEMRQRMGGAPPR